MQILWTGEGALPLPGDQQNHEVTHYPLASRGLREWCVSQRWPGREAVCLVEFEHGEGCAALLDSLGQRFPLVPVGLVARQAERAAAHALLRHRKADRVLAREDLVNGLDEHLTALARHGRRLVAISRRLQELPHATIFLTGATGFLGGHFLRYLMRCSGARVVALVRSRADVGCEARLAHLAESSAGRIQVIEGDIALPGLGIDSEARSALRSVDAIWHFAADTRFEPLLRESVFRVNIEGTRNVLEFARALPNLRRFYHVSTAYVAGEQGPGVIVREGRIPRPTAFKNPYEESKYHAECAVADAGLPATIFRPGIVLGERVSGLCDGQTVYKVAQLLRLARLSGRRSGAAERDRFRVVVDPETTKNLVSADDVVLQMLHIAGRNTAPGGYHHLTHPEPTRMSALISVIAALLDIPEYEAVTSLEGALLSPSEALLQRISGVFKPYMLSSDPEFDRGAETRVFVEPMDRVCLQFLLRSFFEQQYGDEFLASGVAV